MDYDGLADPYAIVTCGEEKTRTKTMKGTLLPLWNHTCEFGKTEDLKAVVDLLATRIKGLGHKK